MTKAFALDNRLEGLAAGIIERMGFDPPELKAKLQPPQLRVVKGPSGVNSYCVPKPDGTKIILIGADFYPFVHHYARVAATYFLPGKSGGSRPSSFWPRACSAVATTLDWISSPVSVPLYPKFDLSSHQAHVARAFGDFAYRFALCHEIAHVALQHVDASPSKFRKIEGKDAKVFWASQQQELAADRFGLELQIKSLPDSSQEVTALASAIYFIHITALLDVRLMLLAYLVDHSKAKIAYTHPNSIHRVWNLIKAAEAFHDGWGSGLNTVHESLAKLDMELYDFANKQQEKVAIAALNLLDNEVFGQKKALANKTQSGNVPEGELALKSSSLSRSTKAMLQLFDRSPLGVLRALEPFALESTENLDAAEHQLISLVREHFASALPAEFKYFRSQTKAQRAEHRKPVL